MVLGSHTDTFYMGEGGKARYLGDEKKPLRKRVCKICGEDCPVWAGFEWDGHSPLYAQVAAHVGRSVIIDSTKDERWIETRAGEVRAGGGTPILLMLSRDSRAVVNSRLRKYPDRFSWVYDQHIRSVMDFFKDRPDVLLASSLFEIRLCIRKA